MDRRQNTREAKKDVTTQDNRRVKKCGGKHTGFVGGKLIHLKELNPNLHEGCICSERDDKKKEVERIGREIRERSKEKQKVRSEEISEQYDTGRGQRKSMEEYKKNCRGYGGE